MPSLLVDAHSRRWAGPVRAGDRPLSYHVGGGPFYVPERAKRGIPAKLPRAYASLGQGIGWTSQQVRILIEGGSWR